MHSDTESGTVDAVYWRHFLQHSPDAVLVVNSDGVIVSANPQTEKLLGFSGAELVGQTVEFLVPDAMRAAHIALRQQFMRQPSGRRLDEKLPGTGASRYWHSGYCHAARHH